MTVATDWIRSGDVRYHADLERLLVDIDSVTQHPDNYNNGDLDAITESIETNGMYRPVYAQRSTGYLVAGNHTWVVCKSLHALQIPVVFLDVSDIAAKRILVSDNQIASLAMPDPGMLLQLLEELEAAEGLMGTGVDPSELDRLRNLADPDAPFPMLPDAIKAANKCPSCGYEWNGSPRQGA